MPAEKITSGKGLNDYLRGVFQEGVKSALAQKALEEKEKQVQTTPSSEDDESSGGGVDDLFGGNDAGDGNGDQTNKTSKTMDDETEKLQKGEIDVKDVIDKLNSIRSGKSFKDDQVSKSMEEYINSLSKPEKVALLAFLKGIAQIVTGEIPGQKAEEPGSHPADVQMQKGGKRDVKHIEPNVIKKSGGSGQKPAGDEQSAEKKASAEDTSAPVPITPKRR